MDAATTGLRCTYDKRLYDRLRDGHARSVRELCRRRWITRTKWPGFWKTTTKPRAAATFPPGMHEAAPSLRSYHQGCVSSITANSKVAKKRISPHLVRGPDESIDRKLMEFYEHLLAMLRQPVVRGGRWQLLECMPAWEGNWTWDCFVTYAWQGPGEERLLVAVNYAPNQSQCYVWLPFVDLAGKRWRLRDQMGDAPMSGRR